jgi:hypothetical protein
MSDERQKQEVYQPYKPTDEPGNGSLVSHEPATPFRPAGWDEGLDESTFQPRARKL